jgi:hypothetical protein
MPPVVRRYAQAYRGLTLVAPNNLKHKEHDPAQQGKKADRDDGRRFLVQTDHNQHDAQKQKKDGRRFLE